MLDLAELYQLAWETEELVEATKSGSGREGLLEHFGVESDLLDCFSQEWVRRWTEEVLL